MHAKFCRAFCLLRRGGTMHEESLDSRRVFADDTAGGGGVKLPVIDRIAVSSQD